MNAVVPKKARPFIHSFTMKWWEVPIFKVGLLTLGIAVGANWHEVFGRGLAALLVVAVTSLAYITYLYCRE